MNADLVEPKTDPTSSVSIGGLIGFFRICRYHDGNFADTVVGEIM
jgi:hypothetical protein